MYVNHDPDANLNVAMSGTLKDMSLISQNVDCVQTKPMALAPSLQDKESHADIQNGGVASSPVNGEVSSMMVVSTSRVICHPTLFGNERVNATSSMSHDHDLKENIVQASKALNKLMCSVSSNTPSPSSVQHSSVEISTVKSIERNIDEGPNDIKICDGSSVKSEIVNNSSPLAELNSDLGESQTVKVAQELGGKEISKVLNSLSPAGTIKQDVHDVESQMEALFAGIADDGKIGVESNSLTIESSEGVSTPNIAAVLGSKNSSLKKGKGKAANGISKGPDSLFGTPSVDSMPPKKRKKKTVRDCSFIDEKYKKFKKSGPAKGKHMKDASCDNGSVSSLSRARGPVVHIEGPKEAPTLISVINAPSRLDDEENESRRKTTSMNRARKTHSSEVSSAGLCGSSLIARYEAHSTDPRWVCVFCKKGCHVNGLGDLFGPYLVKQEHDTDHSSVELAVDRKSTDKKSKRSGLGQTGVQGLLPIPPLPNEPLQYMVWVHEDCAVWSGGVHLIGPRLVGLQDAVWMAVNTKCARCNVDGAMLGCHQHGCGRRAHYQCAMDDGWQLDEGAFVSTCHLHLVNSIKL